MTAKSLWMPARLLRAIHGLQYTSETEDLPTYI